MEKNPIETNKSVKKNILQDPSTADLLLMDPPLPYRPTIAPAPMAPSQGSPLSSCPASLYHPLHPVPARRGRVGRDPWNWEGPWGPRTKGPLHLIQQWPSPSKPMGS